MSRISPSGQEFNSRMIWIQLLAGPVLWAGHFILSYLLVEAFCQMGWSFSVLGVDGLSLILIVFTLLVAIGTGLFGLQSYRGWKALNRDHSLKEEIQGPRNWAERSDEFLFFSGLLLSAFFAATVLLVGVPALFLQACG